MIPFPVTHRSVLDRVRSPDADIRRVAFGDLAVGYWKPSYHYLRLQWKLTPDAAEDAVQAFFTTAFEKHYLDRYDPAQSRFRTFLRVCLDRFVQNLRQAEAAARRGGGATLLSLDFPGAERELDALSADVADADRFFHDETIRHLFGRTVESLRQACLADGREMVFRVFARHDLDPSPDTTYASLAHEMDLTTAQVANYLHAARRQFRELALSQLQLLSATDDEYRREARELFGVEVP